MSLEWRQCMSAARFGAPLEDAGIARTPFQRDYDRVLFSGAFRRLADKTQVFPLPYDDHVHSRLTHSLEVASIGRSLGTLVGARVLERHPRLAPALEARDFGDCVSAACLAHDLGNPPFGHVGEDAIREFFAREKPFWDEMSERQRADLLAFEGNAQTFRIVTRLERSTRPGGLQLTLATIGTLTKYPCSSVACSASGGEKSAKKPGLFDGDVDVYAGIGRTLGLPSPGPERWARHPLALLAEAADDIAYLLLDLEDGLRLRHVVEDEFLRCLQPLCKDDPRCPDLTPGAGDYNARLDRADLLRAIAVNALIHDAAEAFEAARDEIMGCRFKSALSDRMRFRRELDVIQKTCLDRCYRARDVLKMELSGAEAIQGLLAIFVGALRDASSLRGEHMRRLYPRLFQDAPAYERLQRLTDHVSGMTDHYAVRLYRELRGMKYPGGRD
jgi:dGTPase